ncbi:MAG TPA: cyclic nucleotide-binding domain-containing protein [Candidatus Limnocylindrales bacterium]|nr:cyclic nucleotide-binding domain-containing protein [Candidatus Limnocylindrales bacterium]
MNHRVDPEIVDLVGRMLPHLPATSRRTLAAIGHDERPSAGVYLMRQGRPTLDTGFIIEGRVAVRDHIGPDDVTLMTLEPGDVFGWSAVLDGISTASIVALDDARVLLFERAGLLSAIEGDKGIAAAVYHRLLEAVASRLDATRLLMRDVYGPGNRA